MTARPGGPLEGSLAGIRVVTFEQAVAAPLCSRHLADLGADVVKVERVGSGDFARSYDGIVAGTSVHFAWLNRGKRSVALDLTSDEGRRYAGELARTADVVVSNLGPGVFARRVLPPADLPSSVVLCEVSGYGHDGAWADRKAYDLLVQGEFGVTLATGTHAEPAKPAISIADLAAGMYALSSILAALRAREVTGEGAHLHVALSQAVAEWMSPFLLAAKYAGIEPPRNGMRHSSIAPYGAFAVADGGLINIAVQNSGQWVRLCESVLECPELASDPRFVDNETRFHHRDELDRIIEAILAQLPRETVCARLDRADVPWGLMNPVGDVLEHPDIATAERWRTVCVPGGETVEVLAGPFGVPDGLGIPSLGEDTDEVLAELRPTGPDDPKYLHALKEDPYVPS